MEIFMCASTLVMKFGSFIENKEKMCLRALYFLLLL